MQVYHHRKFPKLLRWVSIVSQLIKPNFLAVLSFQAAPQHPVYEQWLDKVFCDIHYNQGRVGVISQSWGLRQITLTETLSDFSEYQKKKMNLIIVLLLTEWKKKMVMTVSGTENLFLKV